MFHNIKYGSLEIMLIEVPEITLLSGNSSKKLKNACVGPVYFDKVFVGEIKMFYRSGETAYLQNVEIVKEHWNNGYATMICEALIKDAKEKNCTKFILEQLQTPEVNCDDALLKKKYEGNENKAKKLCKNLEQRKVIKNYSFVINPETGCYDIILEL